MNEDQATLEAHLLTLAQEYQAYIRQTEQEAHDPEDHRILMSERSVVHDQIIALYDQLGLAYTDRNDVRRQALAIARRGRL